MKRTIIILIALSSIAFFGYFVVTRMGVSASPSTLTAAATVSQKTTPGQIDFAKTLLSINTIKIDYTPFSTDLSFQSLKDFGVTLRTPVKGRKNPFAPLTQD